MPLRPSWRRAFLFLIAAGVSLSGCLSEKEPQQPGSETDPSTTPAAVTQTSTAPVPIPPMGEEIPTQFAWNRCQGFSSTIAFYSNAVDLDDGQTPPGWEATVAQDDRYFFMVNRCERVSIGPFERGPATFLIETHTAVNPPEACQEFNAGFEDMKVLLGLWVDDQELATFLAETYQLPIVFSEFSIEVEQQPDGQTHKWTWKAGGEESTMVAYRPGGTEGPSTYLNRLVWHNGTGVSFLDMHDDAALPYIPVPLAAGVLAPPMKYAQGTSRPYSGLTDIWNQGDHYGPVFRFGDMECKELLG